ILDSGTPTNPASRNSSRRRRPIEPSTPRFKSTAGTDSSKITSWRSCIETNASRRSMKGRQRSSDSSLRVRFSGSEHGKAHARWYRIIAEHRSEEHTSELQSRFDLVCRLLLEKKKKKQYMK